MQPPASLVLDRYRVGDRLAAGAAGTVVGAVDTDDERQVVVKFFDGSDDNFAAWVQEVRLAMRLRHPNIPGCLNAGHDQAWGMSVLVFERALGGSLRRAIASGRRFDAAECRRVVADVAAALVHAHGQGVIHRDIKPENILARAALGEPPWQLTDFGAGRFMPRGAIARGAAGSLPYMAPEVWTSGGVAASDQYSLGVVGLELLTGEVPDRRARSLFRLRDGGHLERLLARLLEPDVERRFPGVEAVAAALDAAGGRFDVTATRDGCHFALAGDKVLVRRPGRDALEHVGHIVGARAFVNAWGDATAVVAADERLFTLSPFARAVGPAVPRRAFVADLDAASVWCLDPAGLLIRDLAGPSLRVAVDLPEPWHADLPLLGVQIAPGRVLLGARGSDTLVWAERDGAGVRARVERAPAPLYDLRRAAGVPVVLCGDADQAAIAIAGAAALHGLTRLPQAVDTVRVELAAGRLAPRSLVPTLVSVEEDGA